MMAINEFCLVVPDNDLYFKKTADTLLGPFRMMAQTVIDAKAPINAPAFTGTPTAPTAEGGDNTTALATTAFVTAAISTATASIVAAAVAAAEDAAEAAVSAAITALVNGAPANLNTLAEIATAINNDAAFSTTVTNALAGKLDSNSTIDGGTI